MAPGSAPKALSAPGTRQPPSRQQSTQHATRRRAILVCSCTVRSMVYLQPVCHSYFMQHAVRQKYESLLLK